MQVVRARLVSLEIVFSDGRQRRSPRVTASSLQCQAKTVRTCLVLAGSALLGSDITARSIVVLTLRERGLLRTSATIGLAERAVMLLPLCDWRSAARSSR
jgi:hypothetical protein